VLSKNINHFRQRAIHKVTSPAVQIVLNLTSKEYLLSSVTNLTWEDYHDSNKHRQWNVFREWQTASEETRQLHKCQLSMHTARGVRQKMSHWQLYSQKLMLCGFSDCQSLSCLHISRTLHSNTRSNVDHCQNSCSNREWNRYFQIQRQMWRISYSLINVI